MRDARVAWARRVAALVAMLLGSAAAVARAEVFVDGNASQAFAGTAGNGNAPYLVTLDQTGDAWWTTAWLNHPTSLVGGPALAAEGTAWFRDPFDDTDPYDLVPVPFQAASSATLAYAASHGRLQARAEALATLSPSSYVAVAPDMRPPVQIDTPFFPGGYAGVGLMYRDTVQFTSATLATGDPIQAELTVHLGGTVATATGLGGGPPYPNHAYAQSHLRLSTYDASWNPTGLGGDPFSVQRREVINGTIVHADPSQRVFVFDIEVGDRFFIEQWLEIWARATAHRDHANAASIADASNTAAVVLRSLTPGVAVVSTSGTDYTVPEPGAGLAGVAALAALTALARRCRGLGAPGGDRLPRRYAGR